METRVARDAYEVLMGVIRQRRSIRRFLPAPVPRPLIEQALEAAAWAPSGANIQPWDFVIVDEPHLVRRVGEILIREREYILSRAPDFPAYPRDNHRDVPCYILIFSDMRLKRAYPQTTPLVVDLTQYAALGWAVGQLHLALEALGLGSYFHTPEEPTERELKPLLGVPDPLLLFSIAPVGFPRERRVSTRRPLTESLHWNGFDRSRHVGGEQLEAFFRKRPIAFSMGGRWGRAVEEASRASGTGDGSGVGPVGG